MKRFLPHAVLLLVAILAYGLLIPQLGFYWDDLPISWIRYELGREALTSYENTILGFLARPAEQFDAEEWSRRQVYLARIGSLRIC